MINIIMIALSFQCMLTTLENASGIEIKKNFKIIQSYPEKRKNLKKILDQVWNNNDLDSRVVALSWIESRLRYKSRNGDKGKACGIFQIHARYSYPMFRRKGGFRNWKEKDNKKLIAKECNRLKNIKYSVSTLKKYLKIFKNKKLHVCHHNSGVYGKCNTWYKKRVDFLVEYFNINKSVCKKSKNPITVQQFKNLKKASDALISVNNKIKKFMMLN